MNLFTFFRPRRILSILFAAFLLLPMLGGFCRVFASASSETGTRTVRVAFAETPGISEYDQYGNRVGLLVDYLNEIAKYTGWEFEYVDTVPDDMVNEFLAGEFELMGGTYYTPGFEEYFAYPDYNMGNSRASLFCRKEDGDIKSYDLTSLRGKTIGVFDRAGEKIRRLNEFLSINGLDCTLKYYTHEEIVAAGGDLYPFLKNGEVDLIMGNSMEEIEAFRVAATFDAQPYYIVTNVGNDEILDGLNMALEKILDSNPNFADEHYDSNFHSLQSVKIPFNQGEQDYIAAKQTVSVAIMRDWHPFTCDHEGENHHNGILPDLLERLTEITGLSFTYVYADTYAQAIRLVQEGKADVLGYYLEPEETALKDGLALSRPYVSLNNIILRNKAVDYPSPGLTCGIINGRALPENVEAAAVRTYDNVADVVTAVNSGEVDIVYAVSFSLEPILQEHRYMDIVPVAKINNNTNVTFAMARPIHADLLTILNKAIGNLSDQEKSTILDRNLVSIGYSSYSLSDIIYSNPLAFISIVSIFLLLLVAIVLISSRAKMRGALIEGELEKAKANSRAKSEFLSRMSHEIRTPMNAIVGLADLTCMAESLPPAVFSNLQKIRSSSQYLLSLINDILDMSRIENGKLEIVAEPFSLNHILGELENMMGAQARQKQLSLHISQECPHDKLIGDPIRLRQVLTNLLSNSVKFTPAGGEIHLSIKETSSSAEAAVLAFSVTDNGVGIEPEKQGKIFGAFEQAGTTTSKSMGSGLGLPISRNIVQAMGGDLCLESVPGEGSTFHFTLTFQLDLEERAPALPAPKWKNMDGVHVLLVEDNDLNAEIAQDLLKMQGIISQRASNGQEAVDQFCASAPGYFRMILMDVRMPVKDGLEATREIRASSHPGAKTIPIVAMTANSFREDEQAAYDAGMTGFVAKPVDLQHLCEVLQNNL